MRYIVNNKSNIVRGGKAIPIAHNMYLMLGRTHERGGINVGKDLEVEDKEVVEVTPKSIKVYSAQPILNGISPAEAVLAGENPNKVFNAQEDYKDRFNLNDDGTKKKARLGEEYGAPRTLGEIVVTPRMSYINYTGNEDSIPTKNEFIAAKQNETRANALLTMQNTIKPVVPLLPNRTGRIVKRLTGDTFTDKELINTFGAEVNPSTCISTVTDAYGRMIPGNKTFQDKYKELGFEITNNRDHGDIVQTIGKFNTPGHAAMVSGFTKDGKMLVDQSHGGLNASDIAHDTEYYDDIFTPDKMIYYRFIGNNEDKKRWINEYNNKYKNKKAMGGIVNRRPFTGGRNVSNIAKTTARLGTKDSNYDDQYEYKGGFRFPRRRTAFVNGKLTNIGEPNKDKDLDKTEQTPIKLNSNTDNEFSIIEFPVANLAKDGDIPWLNRVPTYTNNRKSSTTKDDNIRLSKTIYDYANFHNSDDKSSTDKSSNNKSNSKGFIFDALTRFHDLVNDVAGTNYSTPTVNNKTTSAATNKPTEPSPEVTVTAPAKRTTKKTTTPIRTISTARNNTKPVQTKQTTKSTKSASLFTDTPVLNRNEELPYIYRKETPIQRTGTIQAPKTNAGTNTHTMTRTRVIPDAPVMPDVPTNSKSNIFDKFKNYVKNNTNEFISGAANTLGSIGSWIANNIAINKMAPPSEPVYKTAAKLKTRININPQIDRMRETVEDYGRTIRNNTSSSAVAANRINRARFAGASTVNQLYGQKENLETELINKDRLNQQSVANANVDAYNNYVDKVTTFNNNKLDLRSENNNALISGINSIIQNTITNREKQRNFRNTNLAMMLAYPNLPAESFYRAGLWTKEDLDNYYKQYPRKSNV